MIIDTRQIEIDGKKVLYIFVSRSSIVHTLAVKKKGGRIYKRVGKSDILDSTTQDNTFNDNRTKDNT